jgi:hypothetical protein
MLRQVSFDELGPVDFIPQAVVRRPVTHFSQRLGFKFEKDSDDLDDYESAFFKLDDRVPFALVHYRGNPDDTTTIYFERGTDQQEVPEIVRDILRDFDLSIATIVWISSK